MADAPSYEELTARVIALEKFLHDPNAIAQRLETAFAPRGGEPRFIDENGVTLDYAPAVQIDGASTTLDVPRQRVKVAVAPPELKGVFSADDNVSTDERVSFYDAGGAFLRSALKTVTFGSVRETWLANAESGVSTTAAGTQAGKAAYVRLRTWSGGDQAELGAQTGGGDFGRALVVDSDGLNFTLATLEGVRTTPSGRAITTLRAQVPSAAATLIGTSVQGGAADWVMKAGSPQWAVMDSSRNSHFMQVSDDLGPDGVLQRVMRGPFKVDVTALAAGATVTAAPQTDAGAVALQMRNGADCVVVGSVVGASGSEALAWSYALGPAAGQITVSVTNLSAGALTAQLRLYVISLA